MPFSPMKPLENHLIDHFFLFERQSYQPNGNYQQILHSHFPLTRARVYRQRSHGILVEVIPIFDSKTNDGLLEWRYHITIANESRSKMELTKREWNISNEQGNVMVLKGDGIFGKFPTINPGERYEYESWTSSFQGSGWMDGTFAMRNKDTNSITEIQIPKFWLLSE